MVLMKMNNKTTEQNNYFYDQNINKFENGLHRFINDRRND